MFELLIQLWRNIKIRRFTRLLAKIDAGMLPFTEKYQLQTRKTLLDSRTQASLQLAYRQQVQNIRFYGTDDWAVSIYEWSTDQQPSIIGFLTVYIRLLSHASPHLYFDNKRNNKLLRHDMPSKMDNAQLVQYDGFISSRYNLYAPKGYALDSLVVGAPDVLDAIDRYCMGADVEILGNQLYLIFPNDFLLHLKFEELMRSGDELAKAIDDNLSRYQDERAVAFNQPIGYRGRRLIRR